MKNFNSYITDTAYFLAGSICYAIAVNTFTAPNSLVLGGLTGLSTIINHFISIPIGILIIVFNIPLFILAYKKLGKKSIIKTIYATIISSLMIDLLAPFLPQFKGDLLLSSLYGGVFTGIGIGLVMLRGGSTGGVDIIAMLINKKNPAISIGRVFLIFDFIVVLLSGILYENFSIMLYSLIIIFLSTRVIDTVLYGIERGNMALIITSKPEEISERIFEKIGRGTTFIEGVGGYTKNKKDILLCAARKNEIPKLKEIATETDEGCFIIVTEASKINGEGFMYATSE